MHEVTQMAMQKRKEEETVIQAALQPVSNLKSIIQNEQSTELQSNRSSKREVPHSAHQHKDKLE